MAGDQTRLLHVVNGSAAAAQLEAAGMIDPVLPWDDVLHEGPVPPGLSLSELSAARAGFIHACGWASEAEALERFRQRDWQLQQAAKTREVVLWSTFELYDQLHLMQLLDYFYHHRARVAAPSLVFVGKHFSSLSHEDIRRASGQRQRATDAQCETGARLWDDFRHPSPKPLANWLQPPPKLPLRRSLDHLPLMEAALLRLLEEYPGVSDGVNRTQRQILQVLEQGEKTPGQLFRESQQLETAAFMGDWSFWRQVARLGNGPRPAIGVVGQSRFELPELNDDGSTDGRFSSQVLALSDFGRAILAGEADFFPAEPEPIHIGGVTLGTGNDWRWDPDSRRILPGA